MSRGITPESASNHDCCQKRGGSKNGSGAASDCATASETQHQHRDDHAEGSRKQFQIADADFLSSIFQVEMKLRSIPICSTIQTCVKTRAYARIDGQTETVPKAYPRSGWSH
jgi:hypothetical protein